MFNIRVDRGWKTKRPVITQEVITPSTKEQTDLFTTRERGDREGEGGDSVGREVRGRAGWMCLMVDLTRRLGAGI